MTHGLTSRPVMQKAHDFKSKSLTGLAKYVPCMFVFPHNCSEHTMACHANTLKWNKAVGKKAPDWAWASGCLEAHNAIDDKLNKTLSMEAREAEWMMAYVSTWNYIYENRLVKVA